MNTAETNIRTNRSRCPACLAPITRIGGGEVRVNRAVRSTTAAWDEDGRGGSLSFGYSADRRRRPSVSRKTVVVRNYGNRRSHLLDHPDLPLPDDAASGAVTFDAPVDITVDGGKRKEFDGRDHGRPEQAAGLDPERRCRGGDGPGCRASSSTATSRSTAAPTTRSICRGTCCRTARPTWRADGTNVKLKRTDRHARAEEQERRARRARRRVLADRQSDRRSRGACCRSPGDNFAIVDLKAVGVRGRRSAAGTEHPVRDRHLRRSGRIRTTRPSSTSTSTPIATAFPTTSSSTSRTAASAPPGQNVVAVVNLRPAPAAIFFFTDADLDSANAILTAPLVGVGPDARHEFTSRCTPSTTTSPGT